MRSITNRKIEKHTNLAVGVDTDPLDVGAEISSRTYKV
jgi:hypothetical protein